jgi:hypothetical protein
MQEMQDERDAGESDGCEQDLAEMLLGYEDIDS